MIRDLVSVKAKYFAQMKFQSPDEWNRHRTKTINDFILRTILKMFDAQDLVGTYDMNWTSFNSKDGRRFWMLACWPLEKHRLYKDETDKILRNIIATAE